jgi:hypothetical protein
MQKTSGAAVPLPLLLSAGTFTGTVVAEDDDVPMSIFSIIFSPFALSIL